jgi:hypothetical protein
LRIADWGIQFRIDFGLNRGRNSKWIGELHFDLIVPHFLKFFAVFREIGGDRPIAKIWVVGTVLALTLRRTCSAAGA